ncbi:MAG: hypothetical protein WD625_12580, partial [Balneolales bacterium]
RVPFIPRAHIHNNGEQMVYGWGENMLFKFYDDKGNYQRAFYFSLPKVDLERKDVLVYYEESIEPIKNGIRNGELPEVWPAFKSLIIDDENRLWVSRFVADPEVYDWWVIDETGELLATFTWFRNRDLKQVSHDFAYALETNYETGLQSVVRYGFDID